MSAMVKRNMLFLMMVGGLVGCGTMSGEGHHTGASGGEAARTAQPGQSAPDNVVKTGMSQEDTTAGGTSQEQNTSSAAANQAEQRSGAQPSDRGRAVQVSCPEPTNAQAGQCFTRVL